MGKIESMAGFDGNSHASAPEANPRCADPIFIHGILPRSGTNFLWDLLRLHPDCARAREPVHEDLFLEHSDRLVHFVHDVCAAWDPMWGSFADFPEQLSAHLGDGLLSFLRVDAHRRLVTKSPSVARLHQFFAFFPSARLLILVRDGRSVVHSATRSLARDWISSAPVANGRRRRARSGIFSRPSPNARIAGGSCATRTWWKIRKDSYEAYWSSWRSMSTVTISTLHASYRCAGRRRSAVRMARHIGDRWPRTRPLRRQNAGAHGLPTRCGVSSGWPARSRLHWGIPYPTIVSPSRLQPPTGCATGGGVRIARRG